MAIGDTYYKWVTASMSEPAGGASQFLLASYNGLSLLNACAVYNLQVMASGADMYLYPTNGASTVASAGMYLKQDINAYIDLPPMQYTQLSQLTIMNHSSADNGIARWILWERQH